MSGEHRPVVTKAATARTPVVPPEEAAARLAAIVESSDDAIVSKDLRGIVASWNPAAERMFGYTAAEAVGQSIRIIIPESRQAEEDEVLRRIARGEAVDHFETVRRRKDGVDIDVSLTVSPVRDARGVVVGASKIVRDISERRRQMQRAAFLADMGPLLAASLDYHVTLANIARLATTPFSGATSAFADYALVDLREGDGTLRRVAAAHRRLDKAALLERARRYPPDPASAPLARPLRSGQPLLMVSVTEREMEIMSRDPEHTRIMRELAPSSLVTVPLTARTDTFGVFTFVRSRPREPFDTSDLAFAVEIGNRAALAVDNARLYAESQSAVRIRDQILAIVSHDLRNSLGAIATSARLMLADEGDQAQRTRRLETISRVCSRMNRLIQDLLDASRLQAGHMLSVAPVPEEVAAIVHDACESSRAQAEAKYIELQCDVAAASLTVLADRDRVLQVLSNLVGNAIKFTPDGGTISIRATRAGEVVRFSVADTGPGIRADDLPHIFERFWQAARTAYLGTGLGLPIAKGIVEAHGGTMWVDSHAAVGTTFHFTVPVARRGE